MLFLNYAAGAYLIEATKVAHTAVPASVSLRVGPKLKAVFAWDQNAATLMPQAAAADGFSSVLDEAGEAKESLQSIYNTSPVAAERALALCAGKIDIGDWYKVECLDSFAIFPTEIVRRITFCQDDEREAREFRSARLIRCRHLWNILADKSNLPPALSDVADGFELDWSSSHPHQNVVSKSGSLATAIYLGEDVSELTINAVTKNIAENLRRDADNDHDANLARQRLAVWYRDNGELRQHDSLRYTRFDDPRRSSEFDFTRQT